MSAKKDKLLNLRDNLEPWLRKVEILERDARSLMSRLRLVDCLGRLVILVMLLDQFGKTKAYFQIQLTITWPVG